MVEGDGESAENDSPDADGHTGPKDEFFLIHRFKLFRGVEEGDEGLGKGGEDGVEAGDGGGWDGWDLWKCGLFGAAEEDAAEYRNPGEIKTDKDHFFSHLTRK